MLNTLIVVDYQEGAGGEFMANWLSAHYGHALHYDQRAQPTFLQKWFNIHGLVKSDWSQRFEWYLDQFLQECHSQGVRDIAVGYHLYRWPQHVDIMASKGARFVRIECDGYQQQIYHDYRRKVLDRALGPRDWPEVKFMLQGQCRSRQHQCFTLFRQGRLTYKSLLTGEPDSTIKPLPSQDIAIDYGDFFVDFDQTAAAYQQLCDSLGLTPQDQLLQALIDRNKKNLHSTQA